MSEALFPITLHQAPAAALSGGLCLRCGDLVLRAAACACPAYAERALECIVCKEVTPAEIWLACKGCPHCRKKGGAA